MWKLDGAMDEPIETTTTIIIPIIQIKSLHFVCIVASVRFIVYNFKNWMNMQAEGCLEWGEKKTAIFTCIPVAIRGGKRVRKNRKACKFCKTQMFQDSQYMLTAWFGVGEVSTLIDSLDREKDRERDWFFLFDSQIIGNLYTIAQINRISEHHTLTDTLAWLSIQH